METSLHGMRFQLITQKLQMSISNHPDFNVIKFVVDIMNSSYDSLRNPDHEVNSWVRKHLHDRLQVKILKFVEEVEEEVDRLIQDYEDSIRGA